MTEEILTLCHGLGATEEQDALLRPMIGAVCTELEGRLKAGTSPADCGGAFPVAVAMMVMDVLEQAAGGQVTSFTAGEVSIRTGSTGGQARTAQAERLMAPWLGETGFAFMGVMG
jgi:hypothetical protein